MRVLSIHVSPHQLRKLKKGNKVRLIKGKGFNLIVNPENYKLASRAFNKNKGVQMKLSDEELVANQSASREPEKLNEIAEQTQQEEGEQVEMTGQGIFSKIKKGLQKASPILKPLAREGLKMAAPHINKKLEKKPMLNKMANLGISKAQEALGRGMGPKVSGLTSKISRGVAHANAESAGMSKKAIDHRIHNAYPTYEDLSQQPFAPFSRGYGIHSSGHHAIVGRGGGMLGHGGYMPQALVPQPYSVNYQMSHFLPPHFQHYNNSVHMNEHRGNGSGLYAGRGFGLFA